ncbi:MAG: hypothetical protein EPO27_10515 [Betaproteobacteria bacterium]|nr:MAG: hypothetical protein EPO27_10515 [Betaproteobacteria bacterium]
MRLLPYAKALLDRRRAGEQPWLVVVSVGSGGHRQLAQRAVLPKDRGVARVWIPDDFPLEQADPVPFLGLDVLVVPECPAERLLDALGLLWRAQCATLWLLEENFTASRLYPYRRWREPSDLVAWSPRGVPIGSAFRQEIVEARAAACDRGDEPLFSRPEFEAARRPRAEAAA